MFEITIWDYLILGITSLAVVGLLTPLFRKLAIKTEFVDAPISSHKSHRVPVPYLGGVAIMIGVLFVVFAAVLYRGTSNELELATSMLIPATLLGVVGLVDDKYSLAPLPRFLAQTGVAIVTSILVIRGNDLGNPTGNKFLDGLISVVWIVGITNAINFFDNVDGGASGTVAVIAVSILVAAFINEQILLSAISIVLAGSSLGFLIWNRSPARIYMGDAGALFLGFILAILTIRLDPNVSEVSMSLLVPPLLLAIPILDTSVAVISRIRRGISPFRGGRDHLSHRLMRKGMEKRGAVFTLWSLSGLFCIVGVAVSSGVGDHLLLPLAALSLWLVLLVAFLRTADTDDAKTEA